MSGTNGNQCRNQCTFNSVLGARQTYDHPLSGGNTKICFYLIKVTFKLLHIDCPLLVTIGRLVRGNIDIDKDTNTLPNATKVLQKCFVVLCSIREGRFLGKRFEYRASMLAALAV